MVRDDGIEPPSSPLKQAPSFPTLNDHTFSTSTTLAEAWTYATATRS